MRPTISLFVRVGLLLGVVLGTGLLVTWAIHSRASAATISPVLTYKYDTSRTGRNSNETILNTGNVNGTQFGRRVSYPVDGQVYAEPLFMPGLTISGHTHNVVFVETEHDSVYAFDADQKSAIAPLWHTSFLINGAKTVSSSDVNCSDISPQYGITGTPVIDPASATLYVVAYTNENGTLIYRLHALNITTGQNKVTPVVITASVKGTGDGSVNGVITFNPVHQLQRGALLLLNGTIYITFGSHCDLFPFHGWLLAYNSSTLQHSATYNDSRNGSNSGIWEAGNGPATDTSGNIFLATGNGNFDLNSGGVDAGDTMLKLSTTNGAITRAGYFTPFNQSCLNPKDFDLGSGGVLLLPNTNELVQAGKEGRIYVVNRTNMGKYTVDPNLRCGTSEENRTDIDNIVQELAPGTIGGMWSSPAYWNGPNGNYVYFSGSGDHTKAFKLTNGKLSTSPTSHTPETSGFPGANPVISSNGTTAGTGILWEIDSSKTLRAYNAANLATRLFSGSIPSYVKFSVPTVANGRVFVGTQSTLEIYGLLN